jgi:8-oxo-dGTP pyrophosphatase MutT (NUDIX family)
MNKPTPKSLPQPLPHFTVSVIPLDPENLTTALLYRGEGVRSAKNCLAIPSGLLEHGESFKESIVRELEEELGIPADACGFLKFHSLYRNILPDGFDWVIGIWSIEVSNLADLAKNCEPDKHDYVKVVKLYELWDWLNNEKSLEFAPNLAENLKPVVREILINAPIGK